ncbi:MAG: GNAT family N-acetyltransferase [Myxococcota bacterium]|nr:GNAT family N-acetyltransferase [Myxococcota bacterium]
MAVTIRPAVPDDYPAICSLFPDEEELFFAYPKGRFPLTVDQVEELLARRMEPTVLLTDGEVAGFGNFYRYRKGKSVFIGNVVIDRPRRGRGLGKRIVVHLATLAFQKYDLPRVRISVYSGNASALLLYGSLGFKPYAVEARKDFRGERTALLHLSLKRDATSFPLPLRSV